MKPGCKKENGMSQLPERKNEAKQCSGEVIIRDHGGNYQSKRRHQMKECDDDIGDIVIGIGKIPQSFLTDPLNENACSACKGYQKTGGQDHGYRAREIQPKQGKDEQKE